MGPSAECLVDCTATCIPSTYSQHGPFRPSRPVSLNRLPLLYLCPIACCEERGDRLRYVMRIQWSGSECSQSLIVNGTHTHIRIRLNLEPPLARWKYKGPVVVKVVRTYTPTDIVLASPHRVTPKKPVTIVYWYRNVR